MRNASRIYVLPLFLVAIAGCSVLTPDSNPTPFAVVADAPAASPALNPSPPDASTRTPTPTSSPTRTRSPLPSPTPRCTSSAPVNVAAARSGRIDTKLHSNLIGRDLPILIYLPPGYYDSQRCYPVLYMLHGYGGPYTEWEKWGLVKSAEEMMRGGKIAPFIIAMPEGERSWWFNHWPVVTPNNDGKPWGDYIWKDVVGYMDANYRTLQRRESRAVGGLSTGGQSGLMLGMTHPEIFAVVGAHSPSFREADGSLEFFGTQDYFNQYDPIWLVKNKTENAKQIVIWMDVGQDDDVWGNEVVRYKKLLESLGVPFAWHTWPGRHEGSYWTPHIPDYLTWYSAVLAQQ